MNPYFALFSSALLGQFMLVLMPGLVRAMIQLPNAGVSPRELLPLPVFLLVAGLFSYGFFRLARSYRAELAQAAKAEAKEITALAGPEFEDPLSRYVRHELTWRADVPVIALRFSMLIALMWAEGVWVAGAGILSALFYLAWLRRARRKVGDSKELCEAGRFLALQFLPAIVALIYLWSQPTGTASLTALFLFFGLMIEIAFSVEFLDLPRFSSLDEREGAAALMAAGRKRCTLPAGRIYVPAPAFAALSASSAGERSLICDPARSRDCHFSWKQGRLEVLR